MNNIAERRRKAAIEIMEYLCGKGKTFREQTLEHIAGIIRETTLKPIVHATLYAYFTRGCRCINCKTMARLYNKGRKEKRGNR